VTPGRSPTAREEFPTRSKLIVVPVGRALAGTDTATELLEFAPEKVLETLSAVITDPMRVNESVIPNSDD
jgi:hypothetical protein